jgi:Protein of unknown function (DUF4238)
MTKPRPKKQHYVPQLHLRQFTESRPLGMVWTYDKQGNEPRASLPKETGAESNLYSIRGPDGRYNDEIELWLSDIESRAKPGYEQLLRGEIPTARSGQTSPPFSPACMFALPHS